jgi:Protein of unknown function (DUF3605)
MSEICNGRNSLVFPKLSYDEMKSIMVAGRLELLGRSEADQLKYNLFIESVRNEWFTVADYILCEKLDLPQKLVLPLELKQCVRPFPMEFIGKQIILKNDFPYNVQSDVLHYLLWKVGNEEVTVEDINDAIDNCRSTLKYLDACYYINSPHLKSILEVSHAHIIFQLAS